jgi:hypothetical protein
MKQSSKILNILYANNFYKHYKNIIIILIINNNVNELKKSVNNKYMSRK